MNILSVKISLEVLPDYKWSSSSDYANLGIEEELLERLREIGMEECMIHTWSWGIFEVKCTSYEDLSTELSALEASILEITTDLGISLPI